MGYYGGKVSKLSQINSSFRSKRTLKNSLLTHIISSFKLCCNGHLVISSTNNLLKQTKMVKLYATLNILAIYLFIWQGRSGFHCPIKSDRPGAREIKHHVTANGKDDHVNNFSRHFLSSPFAVFHEKRLVFTFTKSVSKNWSLLPLSDTLGIICTNVSLFQSCSTLENCWRCVQRNFNLLKAHCEHCKCEWSSFGRQRAVSLESIWGIR